MTDDRCRRIAEAAFPRDWEIRNARFLEASRTSPKIDRCIVDFVSGSILSLADCEELCERNYGWDDERYDGCVKECEENIGDLTSGSVDFFLPTRGVVDATLPIPCYLLQDKESKMVDIEGKEAQAIKRRFERLGCGVPAIDWIHPHELVGAEEIEEEPDVCFIHVGTQGRHFSGGEIPTERCRVGDVVRAAGQLGRGQETL